MHRGPVRPFLAFVFLLAATTAFGQGNPTGTISGRVAQQDGAVLPGVTVTAESPNLQGARTVVTSDNGDYILPFLPPGPYTVRFELAGFKTVEQKVNVAAAQTTPLTVALDLANLSETVQVVGRLEEFLQTSPLATTYSSGLLETLPSDRSLAATVLLAPNVAASGPSTNNQDTASASIVIGGAPSFENLFLINGVVVNENLRGQAVPLFIEDAIQETTVTTSAISAEFGRFSGGVVNAITKSGGNSFSGSFRTSFTNDDWRAVTPFGEAKTDKTIPTYEYTFGGPVFRDRLWFFTAGRLVEQVESRNTDIVSLPFEFTRDDKRFEGKLTYSLLGAHTLRGSYIGRRREELNARFTNTMDLRSLYDRKLPENLYSFNYTGVLTSSFFVEAQVSQRDLAFDGTGSRSTDLIDGTLVIDNARATRYWSPTFCSVCAPPEERTNRNVLIKGSWFASTGRYGSHNVVFGFDTFNDIRFAENHQSGSDYRILGTTSIVRNGEVFPQWLPGSTQIQWNPITEASKGTDFRTHSLFVNDLWRLSDRVTLSLGLRYDKNDGKDSSDNKTVDDGALSPRVSATWDPLGDGRWTVNAGYGRYVAAIANTIADSAGAGGSPSQLRFLYQGSAINADSSAATLTTTDAALATLWDWFFANGGTSLPTTQAIIPGVSTRIAGTLRSPSVHEVTGGVTRAIGQRGLVRADGIYRTWSNFYASRRDLNTGQIVDPAGNELDLTIIENTDLAERQYAALSTQLSYRVTDRLTLAGNYTLSRTWGNFDGETLAGGPSTAGAVTNGTGLATTGFLQYPEYTIASWNRPVGDLSVDERHRARLWATYQAPISERFGGLMLSVLHTINSGLPYGSAGAVSVAGVANPGYAQAPTRATYWFENRDTYHTDVINRTDIGINYDYRFARGPQLFVQAQIWNLFNRTGIADPQNISTTIQTSAGGTAAMLPFDPFTETPVEGVHWRKAPPTTSASGAVSPGFGDPRNRFAYQVPRQFRFSVGVRF